MTKKVYSFLNIALFSLILICGIDAVPCSATVLLSSVNQDSLYVGDRIHFAVTMLVAKGAQVTPPVTDNGFGKFIVKEWTSGKTENKSADSLSFNYILTTYTAEQCTIPSVTFLMAHNNSVDTLRTEPIPMRVALVMSPDTGVIHDIKPPQSAGKPSLAWLWIILGALIAAAGFFFANKFRKKKSMPVPVVPPKPPYEEAMESLRLLDAKQLVQKGIFREYVFELSDIVKRYIERRYDVNAAEFTTEEILDWIRLSPIEQSQRKTLDWFFSATDPVKFAKLLPDTDTMYRFGTDIKLFIEATKPRPAPQAATKTDTHPSLR